jgi:hypothetical protein
VVQTDHKPLIYAFHQRSDKASPRQLRHLDFIGPFTTAIEYISGENNVVADTLSRIDEVYTPSIIEPDELVEQQESDPQLKELLSTNTTGLKLKRITPSHTETAVWCDTSTEHIRPYVPATLQERVFDIYHSQSHPSGRATHKLIQRRFVGPCMGRDISQWSRVCLPCQKSKVSRHTKTPLTHFKLPGQRFEHVHVDAALSRTSRLSNDDGPIHQVARGRSNVRHHSRDSSQNIPRNVDGTLRVSAKNHHGSGKTVRCQSPNLADAPTRHQALQNLTIPS